MGLFDFLKPRKERTALDALMENPLFQQQKAVFDAMNQVCATGTAEDELPNGYGIFGFEPTNPIPTNTVMGSATYLSHLSMPDGTKIRSERRGSGRSDVSNMPIDAYELFLPDGTFIGTIYVSPYHQKNSRKAPKGFKLPFSEIT